MAERRPIYAMFFDRTEVPPEPEPIIAPDYVALAQKVGFRQVSHGVKVLEAELSRKQKAAIASEHYRFIHSRDVTKFNQRLRRATERVGSFSTTFQELQFVAIADYRGTPPVEVLRKAEAALERRCFDHLQVGFIGWQEELRPTTFDPILFGRIADDPRLWVIAQWGDDVKAEDIAEPQ